MKKEKIIAEISYIGSVVVAFFGAIILSLFIYKFILHQPQENYFTFHFFFHPIASGSLTSILSVFWTGYFFDKRKKQKQKTSILFYILPAWGIGILIGIVTALLHIH